MPKPSAPKTAKDFQEDIASYVKNKKVDEFVGSVLECIFREKPENPVVWFVEYLYKTYNKETESTLAGFIESIRVSGVMLNSQTGTNAPAMSKTSSNRNTPQMVQQELQSYIESKSVNQLLNSITEALLFNQPAVPTAFALEFLLARYPDDGRTALFKINPPKFKALLVEMAATNRPAVKSSASVGSNNHKSTSNNEADTADSESEDDEGDYLPELTTENSAQTKTPQIGRGPRRCSVSSESVNIDNIKDQLSQVANIPKSVEVAETLYKVVSKSALLRRMLEPEQRELIVRAFAGPLIKPPGEDVIVQGDIGDVFYLLESGEVDVYVAKGGVETKVHTYTSGDAFGQLALMYNAPRAATCRVKTEAKLWALDRVSFKVIIATAAIHKREYFMSFLSNVPILAPLSEVERMRLADSLTEEKFEDGAIVCTEGDEDGDEVYIIKEGEAVCYQAVLESGGAAEAVVGNLKVGDYFGEIALLTTKPRQATVKAKGTLKVLAIDRATFTRVFGSLEDILKRNMTMYTKYVLPMNGSDGVAEVGQEAETAKMR